MIVSFLGGGLARLVFAFQPKTNQSLLKGSLSKTDLLIIGVVNIVLSTLGIFFLVMRVFGPWQILFGFYMFSGLVEVIIRLKSGDSLFRPKSS